MSGNTSKPLLHVANGSLHHTDKGSQGSYNGKNDFQRKDTTVTITQKQFARTSRDVTRLKNIFLLFVALTIVLLLVCSVFIIHIESKYAREKSGILPDSLTLQNDINEIKSFASNFLNRTHKHIFCVSCDALREIEPHFFESIGNNNCCIDNIFTLKRLLKYTLLKSLNEYKGKVRSLQSGMEDLKEDINILETAIFRSNKTNVTDGIDDSIPKESIIWDTVQKNNKLINVLLNRRSSSLHLSGTAGHTGIRWTQDIQSGDLSYDEQGIHVNSGGTFFVYCNIHFSMKACDGNDNFGYSINQEYSLGEFIPIARVQKGCATGSTIDTGLFVQSVFQVELGQHKTLRIQYHRNSQEYIATENKLHDIIIFEI